MKTYFFGGVPPVGFDLQFPEDVRNVIPGEHEFFEFPDAISTTLDYFRNYLTGILSGVSKDEKITIVSLSGSASFLMQSRDILEKFQDRIAGILLLNPVVSYSDVPNQLLRKEKLLEKADKQKLQILLARVYGIPLEEIDKYIQGFDFEEFLGIIKAKIGILKQVSNEETFYLDVDFPILAHFTGDDIRNGDIRQCSKLFKSLSEVGGVSDFYVPYLEDEELGIKHGELRKFSEIYKDIIKFLMDKLNKNSVMEALFLDLIRMGL